MSTGLPSDEVAEDYKNSLEDLNQNSRYEISNLTIIAKENMDHALAISRVLENHIKTAPPNRKLTALYVLDSVVKNVGTPYTLFFGRNLYQTYMTAYTLVDGPIRKKMEEMLKTWKEPVPGSLDSRPVFPVDVTRGIENALIKARTAAIQLQQQQTRGQQVRGTPYRNTPTPPFGARPNERSSVQPTFPQQQTVPPRQVPSPFRGSQNTNGLNPPNPQSQLSQSQSFLTPQQATSPFAGPPEPSSSQVSIETLNENIAKLIANARTEFAANPLDQGIQQRLKALFDLQTIMQSQTLPYEQLKQIHDQVAQLSMGDPAAPTLAPSPAPPISKPSVSNPQPQPSSQPPAPLESLLPPSALAAFMASVAPPQQPTPPPPAAPAGPPPRDQSQVPENLPSAPNIAAFSARQAPPSDANDSPLMNALRAAGMLPPPTNGSTSQQVLPIKPPMTNSFPPVPPPRLSPQTQSSGRDAAPTLGIPNHATLSSKSLKIPRPHLIASLYEDQSNQCKTCARRFLYTLGEKKKKARHLDWHFRVNVRMADAAKRGQSRSWYVGEMEWINSRENDDDDPVTNGANASHQAGGADGTTKSSTKDPKMQWIPVPNDPSMANPGCPICQEKFETLWHDEAQEWVWMDAIKIGGRVYHASCHAEATKDGVKSPPRGLTPDAPVLGKRKAEVTDGISSPSKMKREAE